jgi:hypothetical protein
MGAAMDEYLRLKPTDWKAWIDQASVLLMQRKTDAAIRALEMAIRTGGNEALTVIRGDPRFTPIQNKALERSGMNLGMPPGMGEGMGPF